MNEEDSERDRATLWKRGRYLSLLGGTLSLSGSKRRERTRERKIEREEGVRARIGCNGSI